MVVLQSPNPRPQSCLLQSYTDVNGCSPVPQPKAPVMFVTKLYLCEWLLSQVKLAALLTLDELHRKLGEDYMPLLPDTVPFLAELMEG
ncbi:hypothetical protein DPMN_083235 [Dreissena polymorpha]|uniref:Uncharacterized protein n=1 Tax=Dreissena polymorpha TaxID=45954 RepID=A0A9D3YAS5_DREPO|nr:hypothetical protein DPMN_083235 [Dreissena polymorpha]